MGTEGYKNRLILIYDMYDIYMYMLILKLTLSVRFFYYSASDFHYKTCKSKIYLLINVHSILYMLCSNIFLNYQKNTVLERNIIRCYSF